MMGIRDCNDCNYLMARAERAEAEVKRLRYALTLMVEAFPTAKSNRSGDALRVARAALEPPQ